MIRFIGLLGVLAVAGWAQAPTPSGSFRVKLLTPISTKTSRAGDKITAQVQEPPSFRGDVLEGKIREAKGGKKIKGKATLNFDFETLNHGGQALNIQSSISSVINSHGAKDVDEEGRIIKKKNSLGKAAAATGIGALIGGLAGGAQGAAIGAGVGAAAGLIFIELAVEGAEVSFAPGSEFMLDVRQRRGR